MDGITIASGVLNLAFNKLGSGILQQFGILWGFSDNLEELKGFMSRIKEGLEVAEEQAIEDKQLSTWLRKVQDVAYDVDDLLHELHMKAERYDSKMHENKWCSKANQCVFKCCPISQLKVAHKIKGFNRRFEALANERKNFHFEKDLDKGMTMKNDGGISTISSIDTTKVIGRDQDKMTITNEVIKSTGEHKVSIISITGLGGLGKTTLAQLVYNDEVVQEHFKLTMWIYVSENFDTRRLMRALFESVTDRIPDVEELSPLGEKIKENLKGKKFLLVLDDVWDHDMNEWEKFRSLLNVCEAGSKIVVTTRSTYVAEKMGSTFEHSLSTLSDEYSWTLFKRRAFRTASEELDPELVQIGKEILQKCGGMPLAVNALGSILRFKERTKGWMAVRDSDVWRHTIEGNKVMMSLRLSYYHLPSHLKQCFTICSVFPKGHTIDKEQLIDQWIAHDMITPTDGVDYLEYTGNECFNTLVQMSFLQDVTEKYAGRVTCRMHDLVHDLARSILGDKFSHAVPDKTTKSTESYRYFSLIKQQGNVPPKHFFVKGRATYVAEGDFVFGKALKNAKHLRSITVECITTESVLATVLQIKNLRYLAISELKCETLPEAITDIWSLQALHVTNSKRLRELPKSIGKLQNLRTLNLSGCNKLESLPDSIGDCQMISSVDLYGCRELTTVPNSISRNKNLRVLRLCHTRIERLPSSITTLGNLEILDLKQCARLVELPKGMNDLKKLKVLNLEYCDKLSGIPVGFEQLSRLQKLGMFVVGEGENFAKISELGNAGGIGGHLTIKNIVFVKDPDDAQKARLKHKTNLQGLSLDWRNECWSNDAERELAVLNALEPPPSGIKSIGVYGYPGGQFARWILKQVSVRKDHPRFPCLTYVSLQNFPNLKHLQGLAELPSLRELELRDMLALESISGGPFPSLVRLDMHEMPSLEDVWMVSEDETFVHHGEGQQIQVQIGSHLSNLTIRKCPKLKVKPYLPLSLASLRLCESNEQLLLSPFRQGQGSSNDAEGLPPSFSHLKWLNLSRMTAASSSPEFGSAGHEWELMQHLTALHFLRLWQCEGLNELPESMRSLTSLRSLEIIECSHLRVLPEWLGELQSLQEMRITSWDALHQLPESLGASLCSLRSLTIQGYPSLSSLPQSLQHLTSLQELQIIHCNALHQLPEWLGKLRSLRRFEVSSLPGLTDLSRSMRLLTSLEELRIHRCWGLTSLPEWIQGLTALQELRIECCPRLKSRCEREKGEDWRLVSHIPRLLIYP